MLLCTVLVACLGTHSQQGSCPTHLNHIYSLELLLSHTHHRIAVACEGSRSLCGPPWAVLPEVVDVDYQSMLIGSDHLLHSLAVLLLQARTHDRRDKQYTKYDSYKLLKQLLEHGLSYLHLRLETPGILAGIRADLVQTPFQQRYS